MPPPTHHNTRLTARCRGVTPHALRIAHSEPTPNGIGVQPVCEGLRENGGVLAAERDHIRSDRLAAEDFFRLEAAGQLRKVDGRQRGKRTCEGPQGGGLLLCARYDSALRYIESKGESREEKT